MNIQEFQAKQLLHSYGVRIPEGGVASTAEQAEEIGSQLGGCQWMVKAQIHAGGRGEGALVRPGKGSGIRVADDLADIRRHANAMLGHRLTTRQTGPEGLAVRQVYVEQSLTIEREMALSMLIDDQNREMRLLLSRIGGVDIEALTARMPESVYYLSVSLVGGVDETALERVLDQFELGEPIKSRLQETIARVVRLFIDKDASLVEINPLAIVDKEVVALDAKIAFDNNALFRQPENRHLESEGERQGSRRQASLDGFNYIPLDGDIGCVTVGAGLSMAVLDAIHHCGGCPANFLDIPPDSKVNRVRSALELLLSQTGVNSVLVNVFGGGIMRCDTVCDALLLVNKSNPIKIPLIIRLLGTNADLANRRLRESMPSLLFATNMAEAANLAVSMAAQSKLSEAKSSRTAWFSRFPWKKGSP